MAVTLAVALALGDAPSARAGVVNIVGTTSGALVHNGTTKIDIIDPDDDNYIDTAEWGLAPTIVGPPNTAGSYNMWSGQSWARLFDNATGGSSKVCCDFNPGSTSVTVSSATSAYTLTGYTIATGADDHGRRPTAWRVYGSDDGFVSSNVLLDTVTADYGAGNNNVPWTPGNGGNQQVGEVTAIDNPGGAYSSFRIVFDENSTAGVAEDGGAFQLSEIELIGTLAPLEISGNDKIGVHQPVLSNVNVVGGGRFVRVSELSVTDGRLHISEIEVFDAGITPDELGPASANGNPALSTNDYSMGLDYHAATTTSDLQHGAPPTTVFDGVHQASGNVWSTNNVSSPDPRFTLDLGGAGGIGTVRVYPRNDTCCSERFENLRFDVFADDGTGNPGAHVATLTDSDPDGASLVMAEVTFNLPRISGDIAGILNSDHTYVFEIDGTTGTADMISVTNPNPALYDNAIIDINGATIQVELLGALNPGIYQLLSADQIVGTYADLILPATVDGSNLLVDGTVTVVPEPATLALAAAGLLGLRRRRRA